jgi:hypothetical protein
MKKSTSFAIFFIAAAQLSFTGPKETAVTSQPVSATSKSLKQPPAIAFTANEIVPVSIAVFVDCANGGAGEEVILEGNLHILFHVTINGNNVVTKTHFQPQGISGNGTITGDKYQATGVTQEIAKSSLVNGQANFTLVNNFRIIGQGPGNNFRIHENFHITVNANGTLTAFVDNFSAECN